MIREPSLLGLVLSAIVGHALVTYYVCRLGRRRATDAPDGRGTTVPPGGSVACPDCGTGNERGYRYCRSCVGELPGAREMGGVDREPFERVTR